ncbi:MAG: rplQ [Bacteroidetes bacterium]|jgi:large subunit ribosomal protein L17|nr:rplQ [Bacteroidota bacterium]MDP2884011.1 50S ribosomal protein L17 [Ignavibacteria bacterium]
MRHRKSGRKLGRTASHRKATLSSLSVALIRHKKIRTTTAKAKEARSVVEKLITRAKRAVEKEGEAKPKDVHARRMVFAFLRDREAVTTLFNEIAPKVGTRAGGYTRVVKLGRRLGDGAEVAILELVDYNTGQEKTAPKPKAKATVVRKRGPKKGKPETSKKAKETAAEVGKAETPAKTEATETEAKESSSK